MLTGFFNEVRMALNSENVWWMYCSAADPHTASILRTPAATAASCLILKIPSSPVNPTWVPPHNSKEYCGSMITTLTVSPYFSPNKAIAPKAIASSLCIDRITTGIFSLIFSLTNFSTAATSSSVTLLK